ncbi:MAG: hypothetical protein ACI4IM_04755 [Acutalibacteraceae bacterium]
MHELEKMIEKYRQELVEFSKQNIAADEDFFSEEKDEKDVQAIPVMANALKFPVTAGEKEEIDTYADYEDFQKKNPSKGSMKVQVTAGGQSYPIINAIVKVRIPLRTGDREIFSGYTDINGIVDNIVLPAPDSSISFDEENSTVPPFSVYEVTVTHPNFAKSEFFNVPVFANIKAIQPAQMVPLTETGEEPGTVTIPEQSMGLFGGEV